MNAAEALDGIRSGGANILVVARGRCNDVVNQLDAGEFGAALLSAQQLAQKLAHLHAAQASLGQLAEGYIVLVKDLKPGMMLADPEGGPPGEVVDIAPCPCTAPRCDKIIVTVGEEPVQLSPNTELFVTRD